MMFVVGRGGRGTGRQQARLLDTGGGCLERLAAGQVVIIALFKTYAIRMAAVFMISLATIWLRTGLMPSG